MLRARGFLGFLFLWSLYSFVSWFIGLLFLSFCLVYRFPMCLLPCSFICMFGVLVSWLLEFLIARFLVS